MKKLLMIILIGTLFFQYGCSTDDDTDGESSGTENVFIRVKNVSRFEYTNIVVNTSGGEATYEAVSPGKTSNYEGFNFAYSYAYIQVEIEGKLFTIQPIDYVGETKIPDGKYTYEINANDNASDQYGRLFVTLAED